MFPTVSMWFKKNLCFLIALLGICFGVKAQPANDNCVNAITVTIGNSGYALGTFNSTQVNIGAATLQTGETFAPGILSAGVSKKSIWYKFTLPTTRAVEVFLKQPAVAIADGNVGFAVYKTSACLPGDAQISTKLTPIAKFASSKHPCLEAGEYYVQVSANEVANGLVFIALELAEPDPAPYDKPITASKFGKINVNYTTAVEFAVGCQSIDNTTEVCLPNSSFKDYNQSTWHTFTTPDYYDYMVLMISGNTNNYWDVTKTKIGFRLFEGDITTSPLTSLTQLGGCDSLNYNTYAADERRYRCGDLKPNTTYTVQFLYPTGFTNGFRFGVLHRGIAPTRAPQPLNTIPAANKLGVLPQSYAGISTTATKDNFGCNALHSNYNCPKALPLAGVPVPNDNYRRYKLSTFYSFTLANTANILLYPEAWPERTPYARLFKQTLVGNCTALDTVNIVAEGDNLNVSCLPPGDYVLQLLGTDTIPNNLLTSANVINQNSTNLALFRHLGTEVGFRIVVSSIPAINRFSLNAPGAFEKINSDVNGVMQPLQPNEIYSTTPDTLGCENTVVPDENCGYSKASYREFVLADSGIFRLNSSAFDRVSLFKGDANALAISQNAFAFPQKINGLVPQRTCFAWNSSGYVTATCITPGTFSFVGFGPLKGGYSGNDLIIQSPSFTILAPVSKHATPATAQNLGDLWAQVGSGGGTLASDIDTFSCRDNPAVIDGLEGCEWGPHKATKLIYRQFYLSKPSSLRIWLGGYNGYLTLFKGKATDGLSALTKAGDSWKCFYDKSIQGCEQLPECWYTVVAYGHGPSFQDPRLASTQDGYTSLSLPNAFSVQLYPNTCAAPQFNRPFKASVDTITKKPYLIEWGPQTGHSAAYPVTYKKYTLNRENFDCRQDTAFIRLNMDACQQDNAKVAFYVFTTTQESYIQIDGIDDNLWSSVYAFDVRTSDSTKLKTAASFQPCLNKKGKMEFCKLQPGTYTLVFFAPANYTCNAITPTIYVDQVGYSRFDHAAKAYDFGVIKPDSNWYNGKPGDVNPLNATRAPSNDFFYCTTGAQEKDPDLSACMSIYNPNIYNTGSNIVLHPDNSKAPDVNSIDRRNLWYTFTVNHPGRIRIKVENKTPGKNIPISQQIRHQYPFSVFQSDANGSLSFNQIVANGEVDSTLIQGLKYTSRNHGGGANQYYCQGPIEIDFYAEPCNFKPTRYYIIVENRNPYAYDDVHSMNPNSQVEVSVLLDSISASPPKFDHYSKANELGLVNSGVKKGETDNFTCATRDLSDPFVPGYSDNCQKTLWYKFSTATSGIIRYRAFYGTGTKPYTQQIQLYRQIITGDSTSKGLQFLGYTSVIAINGQEWASRCITPGNYYLILPGCDALNEDVFAEIEIIPQAGDFCSAPMVTSINGIGSKVVPVTVDCHTIGTDYGEFNNTLTCPANAPTANYKTSWYRLDITGKDTLDLTVYIDEKTNAGSTDIKYRMMTGSCGAMQEQSCVQDALTRNTYECMVPGVSYYIQVFTPITVNGQPVNGTIDLNISAVKHVGACAPANNCIAVAEFFPKFDCTKDRNMTVTNLSTFGSDITYDWDFGYNNQKSNAVSPEFFYPALTTDKTYTVKLTVTNTVCGKTATITKTIDIPARPEINLGRDTVFCTNGSSLLLNATSHTGSNYYWQNGAVQPTITASNNGNWYVEVTYNNCKARDTVNVWINPIAKRALVSQALCNTDQVSLNAARGQGEVYRWNTGAATSSITTSQSGYYWCDLFLNGCTIRDSFYVINPSVTQQNKTITICQKDMPYEVDATISGASSYLWNDNNANAKRNITTSGIWWVDVSISGCTIRDSLTIKVDSFKNVITNARICFGQNYRLPSGKNVNTSGTYRDTLRNVRGCDSLITRVNLSVESPTTVTLSGFIYPGQSYTLPWGRMVNAAGAYRDTVRSVTGCDSVITLITLNSLTVQTQVTDASICPGSNYTLPWGGIVGASGAYADTIKSSTGADSLMKIVNLSVIPKSIITGDTTVCQGSSFTLRANNALTYKWSPGNDLSASDMRNPIFTANQTRRYTLEATYEVNGTSITCTDSVRIQVVAKTITNLSANICAGQTYTLPGGKLVNTTGLYADTLRSVSGCDSVIANINLTVQNAVSNTLTAFICQGQNYTLPSGRMVNATGMYRDTLRYAGGCDSSITVVNLTRYDVTATALSATICLGNTYTLPSGKTINSAGTYRDTLRYANGCDSIRYTIALTVTDAQRNTSTAYICAGSSFRLPSGRMVATAGLYRDTVRTAQNCDSLISNITLVLDAATVQALTPTICQGNSYTLPSGRIVSLAGNYTDTLRNVRGCDSIRYTITLTVNATRFGIRRCNAMRRSGLYPAIGKIVTQAGSYSDTIRSSVTGCDSVVTVTLTYREPLRVVVSGPSSVCTGVSATLTATASGGTGGPYTFSWTGANGSGNTITVSPTTTTKYVVTVSDGCTVLPARDSITITYSAPPTRA
jgi:hypothetical protein